MKKYTCVIYSNTSNGREYEVETTSAYKCADMYGRCEGGEVVEIWNKSKTRQISKAIWTPKYGGKYIRVNPAY